MSDTGERRNAELTVLSPAKINWTLAVDGKRPDGFHELRSLVSVVTLYDRLTFAAAATAGMALTCDRSDVPTDGSNLVCRAAELLAARAEHPLSLACRLEKRIPMGGGLGGGSSNAAATLEALNRMWGLGWPKQRLAVLAAELGSDVALFLEGGSVVMSGRGEKVRPVTLAWRGWIVLLAPGLHVSTADVYRAWRPVDSPPPPIEPGSAGDAGAWMEQTFNMLETPAIKVCPRLGELQQQASSLAGRAVRVSGSGSTLYTAFDDHDEAQTFARSVVERLHVQTHVVQPVERA